MNSPQRHGRNIIPVRKFSPQTFDIRIGQNGPDGLESVYWFNYNGVLYLPCYRAD